jgi:hypothetical protein
MALSPTAEGFRAAFRRPSLTLAEISWRWVVGGTATVLLFFGLFEYLDTLPVTNGELLFLRTRHPYLVWQAIVHILRGSLYRAVMSLLLAGLLLVFFWIIASSLGRMATVRALLEYFVDRIAGGGERDVATNVSTNAVALVRLNFLRVVLGVAVVVSLLGAGILAGFASPADSPQPGLVFLLFLPVAALICLIGWALNWLLSLAGMLAIRDGEDTMGAISAAVSLCRERMGAVFAVSAWTGLAHVTVFVGATTVVSMVLGVASLLPWRLVVLGVVFVTLIYFAVADWLYTARLAGYVCIVEMPEPSPAPLPPMSSPPPPVQTTIDRDETILSDLPGLVAVT